MDPTLALHLGFVLVVGLSGLALWQGWRRGLGRRAALGPLLLVAAHPALWLESDERCAERAVVGSALMLVLGAAALVSARLRPTSGPREDRADEARPG